MARRTQADRTAATRTALVAAGRRLFAEHGFGGVGTGAIVAEAEVSRGALYHHFADKTALFEAVLEDVERDLAQEIAGALADDMDGGFVELMARAVDIWLDASARQEVQRITLIDGPSVLGWMRWRELCLPHVLSLVEGALAMGIAVGEVDELPTRALAHVLVAAAEEAAMFISTAEDPVAARRDTTIVVRRLLEAMATRRA